MGYRRFVLPPRVPPTAATPATSATAQPPATSSVAGVAEVAAAEAGDFNLRSQAERQAGLEWDEADWRTYFEERAAIAEHDRGVPREQAERSAFEACVSEWSWRNFRPSPPDQCARCGVGGRDLLAIGTESIGHRWLHTRCLPAWQSELRTKAIAALARFGLTSGQ
jgi:hypothetical protein